MLLKRIYLLIFIEVIVLFFLLFLFILTNLVGYLFFFYFSNINTIAITNSDKITLVAQEFDIKS